MRRQADDHVAALRQPHTAGFASHAPPPAEKPLRAAYLSMATDLRRGELVSPAAE